MRINPIRLLAPKGLVLVLCLFTLGCDGGIFGTGDGSTVDLLPEDTAAVEVGSPMAPETDADPLEPSDPMTPAEPPGAVSNPTTEESPAGFDAALDVVVTNESSFAYTNNFVVSDSASAQLQFINATNATVGVYASQDNAASAIVFTSENQAFDSAAIPNNTEVLFLDAVNSQGERSNLTTINPTVLTEGSNTIIVLRSLAPTTDLVILPSVANTVDSESSQVSIRLVSAALIGDPEAPSVFSLNASEATLTDLPIVIPQSLTYAMPVSNFVSVNEGVYTLSDNAGRYSNIPVDLTATGTVFTLILHPALPNQGLLLTE